MGSGYPTLVCRGGQELTLVLAPFLSERIAQSVSPWGDASRALLSLRILRPSKIRPTPAMSPQKLKRNLRLSTVTNIEMKIRMLIAISTRPRNSCPNDQRLPWVWPNLKPPRKCMRPANSMMSAKMMVRTVLERWPSRTGLRRNAMPPNKPKAPARSHIPSLLRLERPQDRLMIPLTSR